MSLGASPYNYVTRAQNGEFYPNQGDTVAFAPDGPGIKYQTFLHNTVARLPDVTVGGPDDGFRVIWLGEPGTSEQGLWTGKYGTAFKLARGGENVPVKIRGGVIDGRFPSDMTWEEMHNVYTFICTDFDDCVIERVRIHNTGDAFSMNPASFVWTVQENMASVCRDDFLQNDFFGEGLILNNLVDGCKVFYSSRPYSASVTPNPNGLVVMTGNLVRLMDMPDTYIHKPGHGRFFKMDNSAQAGWTGTPRDPKFRFVNNTLFLTTMPVCCGDFLIPPNSRCEANGANNSGNKIVWGGGGGVPSKITTEAAACTGWTVSTDVANDWTAKVAAWKATYSDVASYDIPFPPVVASDPLSNASGGIIAQIPQ